MLSAELFVGWARHRRANVTFEQLVDVAAERADIEYAREVDVAVGRKTMVSEALGKFQIPDGMVSDRFGAPDVASARLVARLQRCMVGGRSGEVVGAQDGIVRALAEAYASLPPLEYRAPTNSSGWFEARERHVFEWLMVRKVGRVVAWEDFEVGGFKREARELCACPSIEVLFAEKMWAARVFPATPRAIPAVGGYPEGAPMPMMLVLRYYARAAAEWEWTISGEVGASAESERRRRFQFAVAAEYPLAIARGVVAEPTGLRWVPIVKDAFIMRIRSAWQRLKALGCREGAVGLLGQAKELLEDARRSETRVVEEHFLAAAPATYAAVGEHARESSGLSGLGMVEKLCVHTGLISRILKNDQNNIICGEHSATAYFRRRRG